jgi:isoleucyl-tRNA synthetase
VPNADSVHLCDYPTPDESLIDHELSDEMDAILRLVSMGASARNLAKIKVRQPIAEIRIYPGTNSGDRAIERFADQIREELNVKIVTLRRANEEALFPLNVGANMKTLGQRFGYQNCYRK